MSIIIDGSTRVVVQGITGGQGRFDTRYCLDYGTRIVAGVTPGRGGTEVEGVPVFNTVAAAVRQTGANASVLYVPAAGVCEAVLEAVDAGISVILATAENVPRHDAARAVCAARAAGVKMIGFNTNGLISPGKCKLGAIGGDKAAEIFRPGRVGVVSRSGGMSPEIASALNSAGLGISTCISMGGDPLTGMRMVEYLRLFEKDDETDLVVLFGEPGTANEREVADALAAGDIRKPVIALIAGSFQEAYPSGVSFGHVAAMITEEADTASAKRALLARSGARVVGSLEELADAAKALAGHEPSRSAAVG